MSIPPTREQVYSAVLSRVATMTFGAPINGQTTWLQTSRRLQLWNVVDPQPAAFLVAHEEHDEYRGLGLDRRRLNLRVWCHARTDNPTDVGSVYLNTMLDAFDQTFGPSSQDDFSRGSNTLGGLVYFCRMEGRVFLDPGDIDGQALMIVPLLVEMP